MGKRNGVKKNVKRVSQLSWGSETNGKIKEPFCAESVKTMNKSGGLARRDYHKSVNVALVCELDYSQNRKSSRPCHEEM